MPRLARAHTLIVVGLFALVPLAPAILKVYASATSVDRGPVVAANERVFRSVHHPRGARLTSEHSYGTPRWGNEGSLVPTSGYRTEFYLRLTDPMRPSAIVAYYRRVLVGWHPSGSPGTSFTRGDVEIDLELIDVHAGRTRNYGFYVSQ